MDNFNNVPNSGLFGDVVNVLNQNFSIAKVAIERVLSDNASLVERIQSLSLQTVACLGYFETASDLETAYPDPNDNDWALVGVSGNTLHIYVAGNGNWDDTGTTMNIDMDLSQYVTTSEYATDQASVNSRISVLEGNTVKTSDIVDNLETSSSNKPLSAAQGVVLNNKFESITVQSEIVDFPDPEFVPDSLGKYVPANATATNYLISVSDAARARNTWFVEIPTGCDVVRVKTRASTAVKAIAFFDGIGSSARYIVGSGCDGEEINVLREYQATIPQNAVSFIVCSYSQSDVHDGFECVVESSNSIFGLSDRIDDAEQDIAQLQSETQTIGDQISSCEDDITSINERIEQLPDSTAAMNPQSLPLTETGYYRDKESEPYQTQKGAHSQLMDIRGYTHCNYYGNISGKILVFFDENQTRLGSSVDVVGGPNVTGEIDLTTKIAVGAVYMVFNCYNNNSDFSAYWCNIDVPSTLLEKTEQLESTTESLDTRVDALENTSLPSSYDVPLKVNKQYVKSNGDITTTTNPKYWCTGEVSIPVGCDRVTVTTHSTSLMSAIKFNNGTKHIVSSALSQSTRTFDVAIPDGATSFIASTDFSTTFRCVIYNSASWHDDNVNVLILGDSITDTVTSGVEGIVVDNNHVSTEYHERNPGKWPSLLKGWKPVIELRNYAKTGAHWCDFDAATFRQQMSEQVQIAVADKTNSTLFTTQSFEPDIIIFACGTNDATGVQSGISTIGDAVETMQKTSAQLDMTIVTDAMRKNVETIRSAYPNATIYVSMPLQRASNTNNTVLLIRSQMVKICKQVVREANQKQGITRVDGLDCRVIDSTYESGITQANQDAVLRDGLHPNTYGQCMLGECIISGIERHNKL